MAVTSYIAAIGVAFVVLYLIRSFIVKTIGVASFFKSLRVRPTTSSTGARGLQVKSSLGDLKLEDWSGQDFELDSIPRYPGGLPLDLTPGYQMQLDAPGREGKFIEEGFWTADPYAVVVAYYRREFPQWMEDAAFALDQSARFRCYRQSADCVRAIEVRADSAAMTSAKKLPEARTIVKYSVLRGKQLPALP